MSRHLFDGEQLTTAEIHQRIPLLTLRTIQRKLAAGVTTREGMLQDPAEGRRKGGKRTAVRSAWRNRA